MHHDQSAQAALRAALPNPSPRALLHGLFDTGELTEKLVALLCRRKGIAPDSAALIPMEQYRQQQFDLLADGVRGALDLDAVYAAMGLENPRRNAQ